MNTQLRPYFPFSKLWYLHTHPSPVAWLCGRFVFGCVIADVICSFVNRTYKHKCVTNLLQDLQFSWWLDTEKNLTIWPGGDWSQFLPWDIPFVKSAKKCYRGDISVWFWDVQLWHFLPCNGKSSLVLSTQSPSSQVQVLSTRQNHQVSLLYPWKCALLKHAS